MQRPESTRSCWLLMCLALAGCQGKALVLGVGHTIRASDAGATVAGQMASANDAGAATAGKLASANDAGTTEPPRFREPRLIEELVAASQAKDDDPSLTADRLLLCFNSKREGGPGREDIWCSERASVADRWGKPTPLTALNSEARETGIALALDGLALWFSSDRGDAQDNLDVYVSKRDSRSAPWTAPARVPEVNSADDDLVSGVDAEARTMYLARRGSDDYDLYIATRADANSSWRAPVAIEELNTDAEESDAYPAVDGRALLFTRKGDLMLARRASPSQRYESPQPLATLNSARDDRDAWSEPDLSYVVFSSDRSGEYRLYEAEAATDGH